MFSEKALFDTQVDVAKASTVGVISQVANSLRTGTAMFPSAWVNATVATLVGFVAHGLVVSQMVKPSTGNAQVDAGLADALKVATVLAVANVVTTGMAGQVTFSDRTMTTIAMTAAAFFAFHVVVAPRLPVVEGQQATVVDVAKAAATTVAVQLVSGGSLDQEFLMNLTGTLAGFVAFNQVVAPMMA